MKASINFLSFLILFVFLISCESKKENRDENNKTSESVAMEQDPQQVKIDIKGMTCEIGCARLIQSKLYKADGVTYAKISFEDSSGIVSFDQNRITRDRIVEVIEKTAGGDIYSVTSVEDFVVGEKNDELQ